MVTSLVTGPVLAWLAVVLVLLWLGEVVSLTVSFWVSEQIHTVRVAG